MILALLMGKNKSVGFPGKNTYPVLGRPLMSYPLAAAMASRHIDDTYITTNDEAIKRIGLELGAKIIDRPEELCTPQALGEDVYVHAHRWLRDHLSDEIELLVLLMCNAATVTTPLIDEGIRILRSDSAIDSAVSVSRYNMWSPVRARKIDAEGLMQPFVPFELIGNSYKISCDRDSQGDVWFADMGVSVVRPRCLENLKDGLLPQRWMGKKIYPLKQWGGFDVDYEWQIPTLEYWLKQHAIPDPMFPTEPHTWTKSEPTFRISQ